MRTTVTLALPPSSFTLYVKPLNWTIPPRSSSVIVTSARPGVTIVTVPAVICALRRTTSNFSSGSGTESLRIGIVKVRARTVGAKVSVPITAV